MLPIILAQSAARHRSKTAVVCRDVSVTYGELLRRIDAKASACDYGGRITALRAHPDIDFLTDYFAVHRSGGTAAPLAKDLPATLFEERARTFAELLPPADAADVLYTTGTTGRQKGVVVSRKAILANTENLVEAQRYSSDVTFVAAGALNHLGTLSKLFASFYVGATVVLLEGMKDMSAFFDAIEAAEGPVATFLVPASIRMLLSYGRERLASLADKIAFIETGAAPPARADMLALRTLLPRTRLYNTYASTEAGIVATHDYSVGDCIAACVGRPMRHSSIAIGADGSVRCSGATLMTAYLGDATSTHAVLHDGVLTTSDRGMIDAEGRLHMLGRDDDVINVGGYKVAPTEVEDAARSFEGVTDCVCIAARHPVAGTIPKLLVVSETPVDRRALALFLRERLEAHQVPMLYEQTTHVFRNANGKIDRKKYAET